MKLLVVAAAALILVTAAGAATGTLEEAAQSLQSGDPVYVDPQAMLISDSDAGSLRRQIERDANGQVFIALLPESAKDEAGGTATEVALRLGRMVRIPGVYAVVVGNQFRAVSTNLGSGRAAALATEAFEAHRNEGVYPVLSDFVTRVGEARQGTPTATGGSREGSGFWLIGLVVGGAVLGGALFDRRRRRARELAEVKSVAREDLVALADDVSGLEADVERNPQAKEAYGRALDEYQRADDAFDRARSPRDLAAVTSALSQGRYEMETAKARLAGKEPPEQRPPCFFDPRHGTSVRDVWWDSPYGGRTLVPACEADAIKVEAGEEPDARKIPVNGHQRPYWDAPSYYGPWAGGYFGGGFLPGLLVGSALGSTWGGTTDAGATAFDSWGGGDFGGGGSDRDSPLAPRPARGSAAESGRCRRPDGASGRTRRRNRARGARRRPHGPAPLRGPHPQARNSGPPRPPPPGSRGGPARSDATRPPRRRPPGA